MSRNSTPKRTAAALLTAGALLAGTGSSNATESNDGYLDHLEGDPHATLFDIAYIPTDPLDLAKEYKISVSSPTSRIELVARAGGQVAIAGGEFKSYEPGELIAPIAGFGSIHYGEASVQNGAYAYADVPAISQVHGLVGITARTN